MTLAEITAQCPPRKFERILFCCRQYDEGDWCDTCRNCRALACAAFRAGWRVGGGAIQTDVEGSLIALWGHLRMSFRGRPPRGLPPGRSPRNLLLAPYEKQIPRFARNDGIGVTREALVTTCLDLVHRSSLLHISLNRAPRNSSAIRQLA